MGGGTWVWRGRGGGGDDMKGDTWKDAAEQGRLYIESNSAAVMCPGATRGPHDHVLCVELIE